MRLTIALSLASLALAACYNPSVPDGQVECAPGTKQCPEGYSCFPNNRCYKTGETPDCAPACGGNAPVCDKTTLTCVQCLTDNQCPPGNLCVGNQCRVGCSAAHTSCADDGGTCDTDMGVCRGCLADSECSDPNNPRCDTTNEVCVPCLPTSDNCAMGSYCVKAGDGTYSCQPGCKDDTECPVGGAGVDMASPPDLASPDLKPVDAAASADLKGADAGAPPDMAMHKATWACCNHVCADTTRDPGNCGSCGNACSGTTCCNSACVDTTMDTGNCGGCGVVCNLAHASTACKGSCVITSCATGFGNCDNFASNGCEASLLTDPNNCGGCGKRCAAVANGVAACKNGQCAIGSCNVGFADCDGQYSTGCEVHTQTDVGNCGACKNACASVANGTAACTSSTCGIGSCNTGFADCDGKYSTGCEVNTTSDVQNCGKCQNACPSVQNGTAGCASSTCGIASCNTNYADCARTGTSCGTNLLTDNNNCGKCANVCPMGTSCMNGGCVSQNKRVFVTSTLYQGALGGLSGADAKCQQSANAASLGGTWKAWLSDDTGSPSTRFCSDPTTAQTCASTHPTTDYVLLTGTVIAHGWSGLTSGSLLAPINVTEYRGTPPVGNTSCNGGGYQTVWTNTTTAGSEWVSSLNCSNWTSTSGSSGWGWATQTSTSWTSWCSGGTCSWISSLYCFEQ